MSTALQYVVALRWPVMVVAIFAIIGFTKRKR